MSNINLTDMLYCVECSSKNNNLAYNKFSSVLQVINKEPTQTEPFDIFTVNDGFKDKP
jgi:Ca2+-binding EF-hand superfamily protein